jgi:hypothetical protein
MIRAPEEIPAAGKPGMALASIHNIMRMRSVGSSIAKSTTRLDKIEIAIGYPKRSLEVQPTVSMPKKIHFGGGDCSHCARNTDALPVAGIPRMGGLDGSDRGRLVKTKSVRWDPKTIQGYDSPSAKLGQQHSGAQGADAQCISRE